MKNATFGQAVKILSMVEQKEVPRDQLQKLLGSGLLSDLLDADVDAIDRSVFRQAIGLVPLNVFNLTVDFNRSVEDGIKAGKYDWKSDGITSEHFSSQETGMAEVAVELFHFSKDMETEGVLKEMEKKGYRPATLKELLAFGEKYPDLQRKFPIIAFGSVWQVPRGDRCCACLDGYASTRALFLGWVVDGWRGDCRFAAVRK